MELLTIFILGWVFGFFCGGWLVLSDWRASAKRGAFEIGGKFYRSTPASLKDQ